MVDFKVTIRKIHKLLPELNIDNLLDIMDCITILSITKHPDENKIFDDYMNYNKLK